MHYATPRIAVLLLLACPVTAQAAPISGHDAFNKDSLAQWVVLPDADRDATVATFISLGKSKASAADAGNIKACVLEKSGDPKFAGYDFATAYTACLFKLGLN